MKLVQDAPLTWDQANTECKKDGGQLAVPNNQKMHDYLNQTMIDNGLSAANPNWYFWVGGWSTTDMYHWEFLDGRFSILNAFGGIL